MSDGDMRLEDHKLGSFSGFGDLPLDEDAIIAHEATDFGWRGLTAKGELLNVRSTNGRKAEVPDGEVIMMRGKVATSRRAIEGGVVDIDKYFYHYNRSLTYLCMNHAREALREIEAAMAIAPTLLGRYNRAMVLLHMGRWRDGFAEYQLCEHEPTFMRAEVRHQISRGMKLWRGENIEGKRLLLVQAHGHGDTIMTLRYVSLLRSSGIDVRLVVPEAMQAIALQFAPLADRDDDADYFCPILHLLGVLGIVPDKIKPDPYVRIEM